MRILFLVFHGVSKSSGISKKIHAQVAAFQKLGFDTQLARYDVDEDGNRYWLIGDTVLKKLGKGFFAKLYKRVDYSSISDYVARENISLVYIRSFHNANPFTIHLLKNLKKTGCRIVMEIPTYPYDHEYISLKMKAGLLVDKYFRQRLAKHLDAIVTFTNEERIFRQKTIRISNGIDFDSIPLRSPQTHFDHSVHLLGVAEIHYWHGFDRVIAGLANYYKKNPSLEVYFHLVGKLTGEREKSEIVPLIEKYQLTKYVVLHGALYGEKLDRMFDRADFAIGSLGRHRSGIDSIRTLKNREYAARGIAFAYSETDEDFDKMDYVLKFPADESAVSITAILDSIEKNSYSPLEIRNSISHLSWQCQMQRVIDSL